MQLYKKEPPPLHIVTNFLHKTCIPRNEFILENNNEKRYYVFDMSAYKKAIYYHFLPKFIEECCPYYHLAKQHYCNGKLTYKKTTTILRQICNAHSYLYQTKTVYQHNEYVIVYYFPEIIHTPKNDIEIKNEMNSFSNAMDT